MNPEEAQQALDARAYVEARYEVGGVFARGRVIGYTPGPVVLIETADGATHTWCADMCEEVAR